MKIKLFLLIVLLIIAVNISAKNCTLPKSISNLEGVNIIKTASVSSDLKRNAHNLKAMCVYSITFQENKFPWRMTLVFNPLKKSGPFWFLPHDDENTAFSAAVYSSIKYGGGFLAVESHGGRYFNGQDPNRNFGETDQTAHTCSKQKYAAPKYSKNVFHIIDAFKKREMPYLAMHNNKDGWYGNGGSGGISIQKSSGSVKSFTSGKVKIGHRMGIKDEDSLVYIAGTGATPNATKLNNLLNHGLNTKYEIVNRNNNDCSMSNYVVLQKGGNYYNIESEHGDLTAQKQMIDRLMKILKP